jgi:hypothetical protein
MFADNLILQLTYANGNGLKRVLANEPAGRV